MTRHDLIALGHRFADILNTKEHQALVEIVGSGYRNHNPYVENGLEACVGFFTQFLTAIPDLRVTAHDVMADEITQTVIGRYSYEGTQTGPLMGFPASGASIAMRSIDIWRVEDGKFVEHWDELNTLDVFMQMGAVRTVTPQETA